jgi:hypothetical protein
VLGSSVGDNREDAHLGRVIGLTVRLPVVRW